jgi:TPR repeat protein
MRHSQNRSYRTILCLSAAVFMTAPALAQTQTTTPAPAPAPAKTDAPAPAEPETTVTIFAKKKAPVSVRSITQMSAAHGDSCTFMTGNSAAEDMMDSYLSDFGYGDARTQDVPGTTDADTGETVTDGTSRTRINDRAVYGDASQSTGGASGTGDMSGGNSGYSMTTSTPGGCTSAEAAFTGGRSFIARKDTSLKEAYAAYDAKDYAKALGLFEKAYNKIKGYDDAGLMLAQMYMDGLGTPRDMNKAVFWLKKVAEAPILDPKTKLQFNPNDPYQLDVYSKASVTLGQIYVAGVAGIPKDAKEARKWYMRADEQGYIPATHMVGRMYQSGFGGEKDMNKAVDYYKRAGEAGYALSLYTLGEIYYNGTDGIVQDKTRAGAWLLAAAKAGSPDALFAVGRMYDVGEGGAAPDIQKAMVYYKEAALKGQVDAQTTLATYLYTGEGGVPQDLVTARKLFQLAAEQGEPEAMFNLAVMLFNGEGGPKDRAMAFVWFRLASASGLDKADAAVAELGPKLTPDERAKAEAVLNPKAVGKK